MVTVLGGLFRSKQEPDFGLGVANCISAIMVLSTTYSNIGMADLQHFSEAFLTTYLMVLPVGLILSPVMPLLLKPKLEVFLAS